MLGCCVLSACSPHGILPSELTAKNAGSVSLLVILLPCALLPLRQALVFALSCLFTDGC